MTNRIEVEVPESSKLEEAFAGIRELIFLIGFPLKLIVEETEKREKTD